MHRNRAIQLVAAAASALLVAACGGGGGAAGERPQLAPPPPPPPPAPPPAAPVPFAVTADTQFPTVGDEVEIRWDAASGSYDVRLSDGSWEHLTYLPSTAGGTGEHYPASGIYFIAVGNLPYQYTTRATVHENGMGFQIGQFAFGVPTAAGDVPTTGTATFDAQLWGSGTADGLAGGTYYEVTGDAHLAFDFGAGALSGFMDASLNGPHGSFDAPRYDFAQTVFSVGSTNFSGTFIVPGSSADSFFAGQFTGPQAAELMAQWQAPFVDPLGNAPVWGTMSGIWIGRRAP